MKTKMAGAALAAVMGACALGGTAGTAEAAQINFEGYIRGDDGGNLVGGTNGYFSYFSLITGDATYGNYIELINLQQSGEIDAIIKNVTLDQLSATKFSDHYNLSISIKPGTYDYDYYESLNLVRSGTANVTRISANFNVPFSDTGPLNPGFNILYPKNLQAFIDVTTETGDSSLIFNPSFVAAGLPVSTVPLPAAAPLFGAALLVLGAAGLTIKKTRKGAA